MIYSIPKYKKREKCNIKKPYKIKKYYDCVYTYQANTT